MEKESLTVAIGKLAMAGEQAGFTVEHMIQLLNSGLTVETLIELIAWRLESANSTSSLCRTLLLDRVIGADACSVDCLDRRLDMIPSIEDAFDTIESAHDFVLLLAQTIAEAKRTLELDVQRESTSGVPRRLDTLRLAQYNVAKLEIQ